MSVKSTIWYRETVSCLIHSNRHREITCRLCACRWQSISCWNKNSVPVLMMSQKAVTARRPAGMAGLAGKLTGLLTPTRKDRIGSSLRGFFGSFGLVISLCG